MATTASILMLLLICVCAAYGLWCMQAGLVGKSHRHFVEGALLWLAAGVGCWLLTSNFR
jgi:hypothetical protein